MIILAKNEIENMDKDTFINYAKSINIYKCYTFNEFIEVKQNILNQLNKFDLTVQDILPERNIREFNIKRVINNI